MGGKAWNEGRGSYCHRKSVSIALSWLLLPPEVGVNSSFVALIATGSRCQ